MPPTNPEASYLRADPSTRPGAGIRKVVVSGVRALCSLRSVLFGLWSVVCGLFPGFLVVVVVVVARTVVLVSSFVATRIGGSLDSGSWVRVPPWWVGVSETARGGQVPGQILTRS